jgi:flagellar biosynthesis/type III secretory pathway chaperone
MNTLLPWQPESELAAWKQLVSTLIQEQVMLRDGNTDALVEVAAHKRNLVTGLAPHIKARGKLLADNDYPGTEGGMDALLERLGNPQADRAWREIRDTERMARDLNQLNGRLINLRMSSVEQALNVLNSASGEQKLYNPGGQAAYSLRSRPVPV